MSSEWERHVTAEGEEYYYNNRKRESVWELPEGLEELQAPSSQGTTHGTRSRSWSSHVDKSSGNTYYVDDDTGEAVWEKPAAIPEEDEEHGDDDGGGVDADMKWVGDNWDGVKKALIEAQDSPDVVQHEAKEAVFIADEIVQETKQVRRKSSGCKEVEVGSQFSTSMKMLKAQLVFDKYKGVSVGNRNFKNRKQSQFLDGMSVFKKYDAGAALAVVEEPSTTEHSISQRDDDATTIESFLVPHREELLPLNQLEDSEEEEDPLSAFATSVTPREEEEEESIADFFVKADFEESYVHGWEPFILNCIVFVVFEREKVFKEKALWMSQESLEVGNVAVAWEGLFFNHSTHTTIRIPYDKIISWTIETNFSDSTENFVDITMDATYHEASGDIEWFTGKLFELRCVVMAPEEANELASMMKKVCTKIRQEAIASVDVTSLRKSSIGVAVLKHTQTPETGKKNAENRRTSIRKQAAQESMRKA